MYLFILFLIGFVRFFSFLVDWLSDLSQAQSMKVKMVIT